MKNNHLYYLSSFGWGLQCFVGSRVNSCSREDRLVDARWRLAILWLPWARYRPNFGRSGFVLNNSLLTFEFEVQKKGVKKNMTTKVFFWLYMLGWKVLALSALASKLLRYEVTRKDNFLEFSLELSPRYGIIKVLSTISPLPWWVGHVSKKDR